MHDRSIRSLARLQVSGATSRVLNLLRIDKLYGQAEEHRARPLFRHPLLNKGMFVKHRLRDNERDLFDDYRTNATKIILPIDRADLKSGGRWAFVGQRGYEAILGQLMGDQTLEGMVDKKTLEVLDRLPSFDPFLLREQLRRNGISPAACYFDISEGDTRRMFGFLQQELRALVQLAGGDRGQFAASTAVLVQKILSNAATEDMEPLRLTMRLEKHEFMEGLFCWKGFLYYKWKLAELARGLPELLEAVGQVRPLEPADPAIKAYLQQSRGRIQDAVRAHRRAVQSTIDIYDEAYAQLTENGQPLAFRRFLLDAPDLFLSLGEKLGVLDHMISFWALRFEDVAAPWARAGLPPAAPAHELYDIFVDFETSLGVVGAPSAEWRNTLYMAG